MNFKIAVAFIGNIVPDFSAWSFFLSATFDIFLFGKQWPRTRKPSGFLRLETPLMLDS